jgi:DIM1 family U5 snRNP protein
MSYMLPHLHSGWAVDQAILHEEDRLVVIRFGHDDNKKWMRTDDVLYEISEDVKNFAIIYVVDLSEVPDFNEMYELYSPAIMTFFKGRRMMQDLGTGDNNKITHTGAIENDKQVLIDIFMSLYIAGRKGRGLAVPGHDFSTKHKY